MLTAWRTVVLLGAVLLCGVSYSKEHPNTKDVETGKNSEVQQRGSDSNPVTIKILPAPDAEAKAIEEERHRQEKASQDSVLMWATIALAVVTTVLAVFTGMLWRATLILATDARKTANQQAKDMQAQLAIAQRSIQVSRETFIASYCPRLIIRKIRADDAPLRIRYEIANIGGTSAEISEISVQLWMPETRDRPLPDRPPSVRPHNKIMHSGEVYGAFLEITTEDEAEEFGLRTSFIEEIGEHFSEHRPHDVFFVGTIIYLDELGRRFETAFFRKYDGSSKRFIPVTNDPDYEYLV